MPAESVRLGDVLGEATRLIGRVDARVLLCHVLGCKASHLIAHDCDLLDVEQRRRFDALVAARASGQPVAYLVETREFYGRPFRVNASVLIPRPETELIVDLARDLYASAAPGRILDLGTGSGALAVTLACEWPAAEVFAVDASVSALEVARGNARALGANVHLIESDWYAALNGFPRFDLVVSNPPYIRERDPHLSEGDVRFEPIRALASGVDGLTDIRQIIFGASAHLVSGGWLLLEHGYDQAADVRALLVQGGFREVNSWRDIADIERITGGRLDGSGPRA